MVKMKTSQIKTTNVTLITGLFALFLVACLFQGVDTYIENYNVSKFIGLTAQFIFLGILAFWIVSISSRVIDRKIRNGLISAISLMSIVLVLKLIKYEVVFNKTAERYLWYSYYIPQCLAPVVILMTILNTGLDKNKKISSLWNLLFIPSIALIALVFTNDLHEQVFSFKDGLENASKVYKWEWGYYLILVWISLLYLANGILLFVKCRNSHSRKKAWIPLTLFVTSIVCCLSREIFNPSFIKMPETVVFSVVIVLESLIEIGFIPSNSNHSLYFDMSNVSALISDRKLSIKLASKNAPEINNEIASTTVKDGEYHLSKDLLLKTHPIKGGYVFWSEDYSLINKINSDLNSINSSIEEEIEITKAENNLKEQRSRIEEQNRLYENIFKISRPHLETIENLFENATTTKEKKDALKLAIIYGTYLKRKANLTLIQKDGKIALGELLLAIKESCSALNLFNISSSTYADGTGYFDSKKVNLIYSFFEYCIESALPSMSSCLVRIIGSEKELSCRIAIDSTSLKTFCWRNGELENLGGNISISKEEDETYLTLMFKEEGK